MQSRVNIVMFDTQVCAVFAETECDDVAATTAAADVMHLQLKIVRTTAKCLMFWWRLNANRAPMHLSCNFKRCNKLSLIAAVKHLD